MATHNRAGEITYRHIAGTDYTYEVTILTCTDISLPGNADREYMPIDWGHVIGPGNNSQDSIQRSSTTEVVAGITQANRYTTFHTFPGPGQYELYTEDPNRNAGVNNIPGSIDQIFSISTFLVIHVDPDFRYNNSVELLNPPKENGCVQRLWSHGVEAIDPDGDSLYFELIPCTGGNGLVVPGYSFPDEWPSIGANGVMTFDQQFGILTWDSPQLQGLYNVAIRISEYRQGVFMGYVVRDMQIEIGTCPNQPPVIADLPDVCVIAGEALVVQVATTDANNDAIDLELEGEPFTSGNAQFTVLSNNPATGTMQWSPECDDVRSAPYLVYVSARDNDNATPLSDYLGFSIQVIAPAVTGVSTEVTEGGFVELSWDPYICDNAIGFKVYRRIGASTYIPEECETGMPESLGYQLLGMIDGADVDSYIDSDPPFGSEVCYRLVACFDDGSESILSDEDCTQISVVIPVMTHVSVGETSDISGRDTLRWLPPIEIDTLLLFLGPYSYQIYQDAGFGFELIHTTPATSVLDIGALEYIATGLDTETSARNYRVVFFNDADEVASSNTASSIHLQVEPLDESLSLSWTYDVPWTNSEFEIYLFDPLSGEFVLTAVTTEQSIVLTGLENNQEYCVVVRGVGGYEAVEFSGPYYNLSQEACAQPFDNTPPCPPEIELSGFCEDDNYVIYWSYPDPSCASDVAGFNIYYSPVLGEELELLYTVDDFAADEITDFEGALVGCFAVAAYDSLSQRPDGSMMSNESELSNIICVESCPNYELPNVFTPNGDGFNDFFGPFQPYRYVDSVDFTIFNRWGNLVFETTDPDIKWDGRNKDSGEPVSDGVYYYSIKVHEQTLSGLLTRTIGGYIHVFENRGVEPE